MQATGLLKAGAFKQPLLQALGAKMYRLKIWSIGYLPMILGIVISLFAGLGIGQVVMGFSLITIPIAIKMEQAILDEKGIDYKNGSPFGNFLAKFLGAIIICGALWFFCTLLINVIKLNG